MTTLRAYALQDSGQCVCCQRRNGDNIQRLVRGDVSTADERFTYACPKVPPLPTGTAVQGNPIVTSSRSFAPCGLCAHTLQPCIYLLRHRQVCANLIHQPADPSLPRLLAVHHGRSAELRRPGYEHEPGGVQVSQTEKSSTTNNDC